MPFAEKNPGNLANLAFHPIWFVPVGFVGVAGGFGVERGQMRGELLHVFR